MKKVALIGYGAIARISLEKINEHDKNDDENDINEEDDNDVDD